MAHESLSPFPPYRGRSLSDVIVIGGGIAGCSTAYFLASDGADVTLLEQFELGTLASGANAGSLHAQIQPEPFAESGTSWARRFLPALPFFAQSMAMWREFGSVFGTELEVSQPGGLVLATTDRGMRLMEAKTRLERDAGLDSELWTAEDVRRRAPYVSRRVIGGAFCPMEGQANPLTATVAIGRAAKALGAAVLTGQRVVAIRRTRTGLEVTTDRGTYRAARVVNAAGNDAARIAGLLGGHLDMQSHPIQLSVTEPVAPVIDHLLYSASELLTLKQTRKGTILIGGGWPADTDCRSRPRVAGKSLLSNLRVAVDAVPAIASARIVRTWAAEVNGNESWLPVIGEMPAAGGFFVNCVPWMGFSGAPAAGRIVASLVQGREPPVDYDISAFRP